MTSRPWVSMGVPSLRFFRTRVAARSFRKKRRTKITPQSIQKSVTADLQQWIGLTRCHWHNNSVPALSHHWMTNDQTRRISWALTWRRPCLSLKNKCCRTAEEKPLERSFFGSIGLMGSMLWELGNLESQRIQTLQWLLMAIVWVEIDPVLVLASWVVCPSSWRWSCYIDSYVKVCCMSRFRSYDFRN